MSLLESLNTAKNKLKATETRVLLADGSEIQESRGDDGVFREKPEVSNKRRKKVERLQRMGFVVDLNPDLQLAECSPSVFLGSQDVAADLNILKNGGIAHIINVATGVNNFFPRHFRYHNLELLDLPTTDIGVHLLSVTEYINEVVNAGGKILIHCNAGISRSGTFVLAYMMKYHSMTLKEAIQEAKKARPAINPNKGFMQQLLIFEATLQEK